MTLPDVTDLRELLDAELSASFAEGLEHVLGLTRHHDVAHEPEVVALSRRIREILRHSEGASRDSPQGATEIFEWIVAARFDAPDLTSKLFEHPLMLAHPWDVTSAEIAKALILCLGFVVHDGAQEGIVLHHGVVDLTAKEIDPGLHRCTHCEVDAP
jgi:hypothetical protein